MVHRSQYGLGDSLMFPIPPLLGSYGDGETEESSIVLGGTSGSPLQVNTTQFGSQLALCEWTFGATTSGSITRGKVQKDGRYDGQARSMTTVSSWVIPNDFQEGPYYIRATDHDGGDMPTDGDALGVWHSLTNGGSNRFFTWINPSTGFSFQSGTIKVEIATDALGANIVATGYYKAIVNHES